MEAKGSRKLSIGGEFTTRHDDAAAANLDERELLGVSESPSVERGWPGDLSALLDQEFSREGDPAVAGEVGRQRTGGRAGGWIFWNAFPGGENAHLPTLATLREDDECQAAERGQAREVGAELCDLGRGRKLDQHVAWPVVLACLYLARRCFQRGFADSRFGSQCRMRALVLVSLLTLACGGRTEPESPTAVLPAGGGDGTGKSALDAGSSGARSCTWGFAPPVEYPGGPAPSTIAVGDLDGDGHADVAVNNYGDTESTRIQTLRNEGDGTFAVDTSFPSTVAFSMAIGPFVSSKNDLLVGCDLFENDGKGTFGPALNYGSRCGSQDSWRNFATADFNGDGKLDLAWALSNSAVVQLNQGNGAFKAIETQLSPDNLHITTLASADFDHDGLPDLAAACWGYGNPNLLALLHGGGDGSFEVTAIDTDSNTVPTSIAAGDVDGDGYADLLTTTTNPTGLEVRMHQPDGSFSAPAFYAAFFTNPIPLLGDINGDGVNDLVVADENGTGMGYFLNAGDGTFGKQVVMGNDGSLWNAALGDVNGDGHLDIVAAVSFTQSAGYAELWLSRCQ